MTEPTPHPTHEPIYLSYAEFRAQLPTGGLRLIVDPVRAQKYIRHRLFIVGIALPLMGIGTALALSGYPWAGLPMVLIGIILPRVVKSQAAKILLYLAQQDAKTYQEAIDFEILEVRYAD